MSEELKPCPFCGEKEKISFDFYDDDSVFVVCWHCFANGSAAYSKHEAVEAWNKRAYEKELDNLRKQLKIAVDELYAYQQEARKQEEV